MIKAESDVFRGDIQHSVRVRLQTRQIRISKLFSKKVTQRISAQPLSCQRASGVFIPESVTNRNQLLNRAEVVRLHAQTLIKITLCLCDVPFTRKQLCESESASRTKLRHEMSRFKRLLSLSRVS